MSACELGNFLHSKSGDLSYLIDSHVTDGEKLLRYLLLALFSTLFETFFTALV